MHTSRYRTLLGLVRLFRFELPFTAGICVVLGEMLALGGMPTLMQAGIGFLSIFFLSATALILNDYFDRDTDAVNAPHRPLPSGMVTPRQVIVLAAGTAAAGLAVSAAAGGTAFIVAFLVWCVGVAYNARFKRTGLPGNLMVAFSVGMTFVFGGIVVGKPTDGVVLWFGLLAMLFDLGEEIAADAMDAEGDKVIGSRSLAIHYGPRTALKVSASVFGAVIIISIVPFLNGWLQPLFLIPIAIMDGAIIYGMIRLLSPATAEPRTYVRMIYLGGSFSILLLIIMRLMMS